MSTHFRPLEAMSSEPGSESAPPLWRWSFLISTLLGVGVVTAVVPLLLAALSIALIAVVWIWPTRSFLILIGSWALVSPYLWVQLSAPLPDVRYERVGLVLLVAVVIVRAANRAERLPRIGAAVLAFLIIRIGSTLAWGLWGGATPAIGTVLSGILLPFLVYYLTASLLRTESMRVAALGTIALSAVLVAMTGLVERFMGVEESLFPVTTGTASGLRYGGVPNGRAAGIIGNPAVYGAIVSIGLIAVLVLLNRKTRAPRRVLLISAAGLLGYSLLVSFTRSAWVAGVLATLAWTITSGRFRLRIAALWSTLGVIGLLAALSLGIQDSTVIQNRVLEGENVLGRFDRAAFSLALFAENPITGLGDGGLDNALARRFAADGTGFDTSHNTFLTIAVDGGAPGLAVFVILFGSWLAIGIRSALSLPPGTPRDLIAFAIAGLVAYLVSGLFIELKWFGYFNSLAWLCGALLVSVDRQSRSPAGRSAPVVGLGSAR